MSNVTDTLIQDGLKIVGYISNLVQSKDKGDLAIEQIKNLVLLCRELQKIKDDLDAIPFPEEDVQSEKAKLEKAYQEFSTFIVEKYPL